MYMYMCVHFLLYIFVSYKPLRWLSTHLLSHCDCPMLQYCNIVFCEDCCDNFQAIVSGAFSNPYTRKHSFCKMYRSVQHYFCSNILHLYVGNSYGKWRKIFTKSGSPLFDIHPHIKIYIVHRTCLCIQMQKKPIESVVSRIRI